MPTNNNRAQVLYLNTAKSLTQVLVLWLAFLILNCQANDAVVADKAPVAPWISNLHSFAAGGSYQNFSQYRTVKRAREDRTLFLLFACF